MMKRYTYIILAAALLLMWSCINVDESNISPSTPSQQANVEVLGGGKLRVTASLESLGMTEVATRSSVFENTIYDGWCLVFGEDEDNHKDEESSVYTDDSPLIDIVPITTNANGTFFLTFSEYTNVAFMRIVANLTDRENEGMKEVMTWKKVLEAQYGEDAEDGSDTEVADALQTPPDKATVQAKGIATFGQYRHQSVGLDGLYAMTYETTTSDVNFTINGAGDDATFAKGYLDGVDDDDNIIYTQNSVQYTTVDGLAGTSTVTGLPETYNTNEPNPASLTSNGMPMTSYGFVLESITEDKLAEMFGTVIDMIRTCSKVTVEDKCGFSIEEVTVINAAQEARMRSTVIATAEEYQDGKVVSVSPTFSVPVDLGGRINYQPLESSSPSISDPIYFYPNSGGDYQYNEGAVNKDVNPQYIIIKGTAPGYDTPGYYKVALKAQYPLASDSDQTNMGDRTKWSALTYDILRNTDFTVNLLGVDKAGYKTFEDAADVNNPASNVSYSITIRAEDSRYEILVSNGTYYVELETSRVYIKGYVDDGIEGCYVDFKIVPSSGNYTPATYVQSSGYSADGSVDYNSTDVVINSCEVWTYDKSNNLSETSTPIGSIDNTFGDRSEKVVLIDSYDSAIKVRVHFEAKASGRVRLRIGDILKFIPVVYDPAPVSINGTTAGESIVVQDTTNNIGWDDFRYSDIVVFDRTEYEDVTDASGDPANISDEQKAEFMTSFKSDGSLQHTTAGYYNYKPELRARIFPKEGGDGISVLYLRQASDFRLIDSDKDPFVEDKDNPTAEPIYTVQFTALGNVGINDTKGLFSGAKGDKHIEFSTKSDSGGNDFTAESVDALTISVETVETTVDAAGNPLEQSKFKESYDDTNETVQLSVEPLLTQSQINNQSYADYQSDFIRYNTTATSTVTVSNSAGDTKVYTVGQTQYPPIYIVARETGQKPFTLKKASVSNKENTCVYAIAIYNWDGNTTTGSWSYGWSEMDSYGDMQRSLYACLLDYAYVNKYITTFKASGKAKDDDDLTRAYSGYSGQTGGSGSTANGSFTYVEEYYERLATGLTKDIPTPDSSLMMMREYDALKGWSSWAMTSSVEPTLTLIIKDRFGEEYKTVKSFDIAYPITLR